MYTENPKLKIYREIINCSRPFIKLSFRRRVYKSPQNSRRVSYKDISL